MTCDHAGCSEAAEWKTRFGNGRIGRRIGKQGRQTYAHYCTPHKATVEEMFVLCDLGRIVRKDEPNGPSRTRLSGRHPDLVARLSP